MVQAVLISGMLLPLVAGSAPASETVEPEHASSDPVFRVGGLRAWIFRSFMVDAGDDATTLGIEVESYLNVGATQIKNIAYLEVAEHPRGIPGQPQGNPSPGVEPATGISDLLTAFLFSKRGHHGKHHFAPGFAAQFPTGSDKTLGSGKWSLGPSVDYEYESGPLFAGAIALQIWSVAGDAERKDVSMLMIKPFVYYSLSSKWDLMYVPYGITVYWNKPSGEQVYLPLGGGAQRQIPLGSGELDLALQLFYNVVRPTEGTVWDLRLLIDYEF
jgi:hypothetical protein